MFIEVSLNFENKQFYYLLQFKTKKDLADCYIRVSTGLNNIATAELEPLSK
jgi:hypothetical protein